MEGVIDDQYVSLTPQAVQYGRFPRWSSIQLTHLLLEPNWVPNKFRHKRFSIPDSRTNRFKNFFLVSSSFRFNTNPLKGFHIIIIRV